MDNLECPVDLTACVCTVVYMCIWNVPLSIRQLLTMTSCVKTPGGWDDWWVKGHPGQTPLTSSSALPAKILLAQVWTVQQIHLVGTCCCTAVGELLSADTNLEARPCSVVLLSSHSVRQEQHVPLHPISCLVMSHLWQSCPPFKGYRGWDWDSLVH